MSRQLASIDLSSPVTSVELVNAEATEMKIVWGNGIVGRVCIGKGGSIVQTVVLNADGNRNMDMEERIQGAKRIDKITEHIAT